MDILIDSDLSDVSDFDINEPAPIRPYQYEPIANARSETVTSDEESTSDSDPSYENDIDEQIPDVSIWCRCNNCINMPTVIEAKCCQTTNVVDGKIEETSTCITEHEGFISNCLNIHVMEVAYYDYVLTSGPLEENQLIHHWNDPDAETLMLTPDAELYIVSKVDDAIGAMVGHIPSLGWGQTASVQITQTAGLNITTTHKDPVGGDISSDGQDILIKTRNKVLHFSMNGNTDYLKVLAGSPISLPYIQEHRGENVAFSPNGRSYFTLGEGSNEPLYRYDATI